LEVVSRDVDLTSKLIYDVVMHTTPDLKTRPNKRKHNMRVARFKMHMHFPNMPQFNLQQHTECCIQC